MIEVINPILQWLNAHPELSGLATFVISGAESVAIIGTIVPGSVTMTAVGTLAGAGIIPFWPTIIFAIMGAVAGDGISYLLGHFFKNSIHKIWPFRNNPEWLAKGERFIHKHGRKSVFIGRFVGPLRAVIPVVAGTLGMRPVRFFTASIIASIFWAPIYMFPGLLLGAASLELPPDIAVHVVLMLLMSVMFYIFCIWVIYRIFVLIGDQINNALTKLWNRMQKSPVGNVITFSLKHHNVHKTHGQLVLAFYFILVSALFYWLARDIAVDGPQSIFLNNATYYFFHTMHGAIADQVMLCITFLGEKSVVLPIAGMVFIWLMITKRFYAALHVLALAILSAGSAEIAKHLVHSPRPVGLQQSPSGFSFPSGHATLATSIYVGIGLLFSTIFKDQRRFFIFCGIFLAFIIGISRLYLEAHWLTDVVGGWLLGSAVLILITISFNRKKIEPPKAKGLFFVFFVSLFAFFGLFYHHNMQRLKSDYRLIDYPVYVTTETDWWQQNDAHLPRYRSNRFGMANQVLNLQWVGNLPAIQQTLLENGWEIPPNRDWISVIMRLSDVQSTQHLSLMSPLYLDQKPVLVLIKRIASNKNLIVLRLWNSHVDLQNTKNPLWVGSIELTPRTYNWLLGNRTKFIVTKDLLFPNHNNAYVTKEISVEIHKKSKAPTTQNILMIKPN